MEWLGMGHEQVCAWLGLPPDTWPPDHYALLGLTPGERDVERIEQHVHERLMRLRPYQLNHPDQVTEAMNRLARAFTCLTDPAAKAAYDVELLGPPPGPAPPPDAATGTAPPPIRQAPANGHAAPEPAAPDAADPLAWLYGPWSAPGEGAVAPPPTATVIDYPPAPAANGTAAAPEPPPAPAEALADDTAVTMRALTETAEIPTAAPAPADPAAKAARCLAARRGLGTTRALCRRITATRRLLLEWERAGRYLKDPARPLTRAAEARDLGRRLGAIRRLLAEFPPLLGEVGQPGYFVVALGGHTLTVARFSALGSGQRETLAQDWYAGHRLLTAHRHFLLVQLKGWRRAGIGCRLRRAAEFVYHDRPGLFLLGLVGVATVVVACWLLLPHFRRANVAEHPAPGPDEPTAIRQEPVTTTPATHRSATTTTPGSTRPLAPAPRGPTPPPATSRTPTAVPKPPPPVVVTPTQPPLTKLSAGAVGGSPITAVALSADGKFALSGSRDGVLHRWDLEALRLAESDPPALGDEIYSLAASPDGEHVLVSWFRGLSFGKPVAGGLHRLDVKGYDAFVRSVAFTPDSQRVFFGGDDHRLVMYNFATRELAQWDLKSRINCVRCSPRGRHVVAGTDDHSVWYVDSWKPTEMPHRLTGHEKRVNCVAFSPDGRLVLSGSDDGTIRRWDLAAKDIRPEPLAKGLGEVLCLALTPDGKRVLAGTSDGALHLWNVADGKAVVLAADKVAGAVTAVAVTPDGRHAVTSSSDSTLTLWALGVPPAPAGKTTTSQPPARR